MKKSKKWLLATGLCILLLPLASWAFVKPSRILLPELNGVHCIQKILCLEDPREYQRAYQLQQQSLAYINTQLGAIERMPRFIFCSSHSCFQKFGLNKQAAVNIASLAIVISPRGWQPHYLKHELIHQLQYQQLGSLRMLLLTPEWFKEGMAYALSEDPRRRLSPHFEQQKQQFQQWYKKHQLTFWSDAKALSSQ